MTEPQLLDIPLKSLVLPTKNGETLDVRDHRAIQEMEKSLKLFGQKTPISVRDNGNGTYTIINGRTRYTAADRLKWETLRCEVVEIEDTLMDMAVSNLQREMSDWELAKLIAALKMDQHSEREMCAALGISRAKLRLYADLFRSSPEVIDRVKSGRMSMAAFQKIAKQTMAAQAEVIEEAESKVKNDEGKLTAQAVKSAKQRIKAEKAGTRLAGDVKSLAERINTILTECDQVVSLSPYSPAERIKIPFLIEKLQTVTTQLQEAM